MRAAYHQGGRWLSGSLAVSDGRVLFKADMPSQLPQGPHVRSTGRVEDVCTSAAAGTASMVASHRPPDGMSLVFLVLGRPTMERQAAFAVEDLAAVLDAFPQRVDNL